MVKTTIMVVVVLVSSVLCPRIRAFAGRKTTTTGRTRKTIGLVSAAAGRRDCSLFLAKSSSSSSSSSLSSSSCHEIFPPLSKSKVVPWRINQKQQRLFGSLVSDTPSQDNKYENKDGSGRQPKTLLTNKTEEDDDGKGDDEEDAKQYEVTILQRGTHHLVVAKPPGVVCHHSEWTGSRANLEVPMIQRTRDTLKGRRVNLVHRLDRGASGCLLMTFAATAKSSSTSATSKEADETAILATSLLCDAMTAKSTTTTEQNDDGEPGRIEDSLSVATARKTYIALVRGEGILHGRDFCLEGGGGESDNNKWFCVDRPIRDEAGTMSDAKTWFRFVAGQSELVEELPDGAGRRILRPRVSLVLARPETGRWHQIRRHLNGLSHPILGDSSHGSSQTNREWRKHFDLPGKRTCLHLSRIELAGPIGPLFPDGIDVSCPLAPDMLHMLQTHMPDVLKQAEPILKEEGISLY